MTPYELRFEIFRQAYSVVADTYHAKVSESCGKNDGVLPSDFNEKYPTMDDILQHAKIINDFVSSN